MTREVTRRSILIAALATLALFTFYSVLLTLISGRTFMLIQLRQDLPFLAFLLPGFGAQVGMYAQVRGLAKVVDRTTMAATGASGGVSGAAMVACCAHYLPTLLPFLGLSAFATVVMQFRTPLLLFAIASNGLGLYIVGRALRRVRRQAQAADGPASLDPVCGMTVRPEPRTPRTVIDSKTYHFCSDGCLEAFTAEPGRYQIQP